MKYIAITIRYFTTLEFSQLILLYTLFYSATVTADDTPQIELVLTPTKCVSLREGQTCYADVELQWHASQSGDYCLFSNLQEAPMQCWRQKDQASFEGEIASKQNVLFTIKRDGHQITLAATELKMAWVYKSKRVATSWRVF
ncbi:MAG: DUF3019 domain-containing protein [Aestuariibacter sp.]